MKRILFSLLAVLCITQPTQAQTKSNAPEYLQTIFDHMNVRTTLEFGLSTQTTYFLESSKKVISIDFITNGYGPDNIKNAIERNRSYSNWIPIAFFSGFHGDVNWAPYRYYGSESVYKATSHIGATHQSFASIDDFYITELNSFITNLKKCYKIDVAQIGGCVLIRGDIVQILFGKVPVIIGEATSYINPDYFGYKNIVVPNDYETINIPKYDITIWISKNEEHRSLAEKLKAFAY